MLTKALLWLGATTERAGLIAGRRTGHFMPVSLLDSQVATLETPRGEPLVFRQDVVSGIDQIAEASVDWLRKTLP
ncbi:hypothetical protein [Phyllobacterium sp. YR531]|uniref:hypothetical protein n=1 Tax=Phyllobacterium sp. YR531 TaxID=1144343 RepID=UPI0009D92DAC|nr:hypothetical protein [Phyllobacterium sp. YR531]